jgi:hypothetical protein
MRTRAALVAVATVSGLLVAPTSAAGVEPTCQGRPATIVASSKPGIFTDGTEGDDVIVGTYAQINALGGDDLICLRNGSVASGDGDDTVLATGTAASGVSAYLGPGDDRYIGSPGSDYVRLADVAPDDHPVLDLGAGKDSLAMELQAGSSVQVQAGEGADDLVLTGDSAEYVFDLGTGEVTRAGVEVASLLGFESHDLSFGGTSACAEGPGPTTS